MTGAVQDFDFLFVVAQVAVAFAGFASIVAALVQVGVREHPTLNIARLRALLGYSLIVIFFSLAPYTAARLIANEEWAWRISSGIFLVAVGTSSASAFAFLRAHGAEMPFGYRTPVIVWIVFVLFALGPIPVLAADALGVFGQQTAAVYEACLLSYLIVAGSNFLRVMNSLIAQIDGGSVSRSLEKTTQQ